MRYDKNKIKANFCVDFAEYLLDYIREVEALGAKFVSYSNESDGEIEHHIYQFSVDKNFKESKTLLNRDDDSQPHNNYRIYFGDLFIYETRYT